MQIPVYRPKKLSKVKRLRNKCSIDGAASVFYDLMNSGTKENTINPGLFEYLGYGKITEIGGKPYKYTYYGYFWRRIDIPEDQKII